MYILQHQFWHLVALLPCKILPSCFGPSWPQLLLLAKKALFPLAEIQTLLLSARMGNKKELQREGQQSLSFSRLPPRLFKPLSMSSVLNLSAFFALQDSNWQAKEVTLARKYKSGRVLGNPFLRKYWNFLYFIFQSPDIGAKSKKIAIWYLQNSIL